jgi:hypothetical protein
VPLFYVFKKLTSKEGMYLTKLLNHHYNNNFKVVGMRRMDGHWVFPINKLLCINNIGLEVCKISSKCPTRNLNSFANTYYDNWVNVAFITKIPKGNMDLIIYFTHIGKAFTIAYLAWNSKTFPIVNFDRRTIINIVNTMLFTFCMNFTFEKVL